MQLDCGLGQQGAAKPTSYQASHYHLIREVSRYLRKCSNGSSTDLIMIPYKMYRWCIELRYVIRSNSSISDMQKCMAQGTNSTLSQRRQLGTTLDRMPSLNFLRKHSKNLMGWAKRLVYITALLIQPAVSKSIWIHNILL